MIDSSFAYHLHSALIIGDLYVDGALFDNFPLNAFDGWFLKAGSDGGFHDQVLKLNPKLLEDEASAVDAVKIFRESLASSYAEPNPATIGFRLTCSDDPDNFSYSAFLSLDWRRNLTPVPQTLNPTQRRLRLTKKLR